MHAPGIALTRLCQNCWALSINELLQNRSRVGAIAGKSVSPMVHVSRARARSAHEVASAHQSGVRPPLRAAAQAPPLAARPAPVAPALPPVPHVGPARPRTATVPAPASVPPPAHRAVAPVAAACAPAPTVPEQGLRRSARGQGKRVDYSG